MKAKMLHVMNSKPVIGVACLVFLLSCRPPTSVGESPSSPSFKTAQTEGLASGSEVTFPEEAIRARAVLKPFKESFLEALTSMMAQGPENAIEGCRSVAPALAEAASKNGIRVGRTSHKLRNPNSAPKDWMKPFLEEFQKLPPDPSSFRIVKLADGRTGYAEPIYVKSLCLACHGTNLERGLRAKLIELYPEDRATGFKEGDFRGLMWVELP